MGARNYDLPHQKHKSQIPPDVRAAQQARKRHLSYTNGLNMYNYECPTGRVINTGREPKRIQRVTESKIKLGFLRQCVKFVKHYI